MFVFCLNVSLFFSVLNTPHIVIIGIYVLIVVFQTSVIIYFCIRRKNQSRKSEIELRKIRGQSTESTMYENVEVSDVPREARPLQTSRNQTNQTAQYGNTPNQDVFFLEKYAYSENDF